MTSVQLEPGTRLGHFRIVSRIGAGGMGVVYRATDENLRRASGNLRDIYFYRDQLEGHTDRTYHPGR